MPFGLRSTQDQLADIREEADNGMAIVHIDTCLSSFLQDHHNRDGECLFGVHVDGSTSRHDVMTGLLDEVRSTGDRIPEYISDDDVKACVKSWFADAYGTSEEALAKPFDASLEVIDEEERDTIGGDEMPQAWFLFTWTTRAATLEERQDVTSVSDLGDGTYEVTDDVGATMTGTFDEVTAWLEAGLDKPYVAYDIRDAAGIVVHNVIVTDEERQTHLADYADHTWTETGRHTLDEVQDMSYTDRGLAHLDEGGDSQG